MASSLDQLRQYSTVVADTGDFELMAKYKPTDATTNPSLVLAAFQKASYAKLLEEAIKLGKGNLEDTVDLVCVLLGCEILKIIPGRVSTEVDARLSYNTEQSVKKGLKLIKLYQERGHGKDRILIKLASTWEGIQAAKVLENEHGVHCNMTLLFSMAQAVPCAEVGATLISPFVGRIYDYYGIKDYPSPSDDPGVVSVSKIYDYYKYFDYKTVVMAASFRYTGQIKCLAGCDLLTISPSLLNQLDEEKGVKLERRLCPNVPKLFELEPLEIDEVKFRKMMEANAMASSKLKEGIEKFVVDQEKMEALVKSKMG